MAENQEVRFEPSRTCNAHQEDGHGRSDSPPYYSPDQMTSTFLPVLLCMLFVSVTLMSPLAQFYKPTPGVHLIYTPFSEISSDSENAFTIPTQMWRAVANASIFLSVIVVMTFIFVALYKFACMRCISVWMIFSTVVLLFLFAGVFLCNIVFAADLPVDYITFFIIVWNFAIPGILVIHWFGPLRLHQAYLVVSSSLFALTLIKYLPNWSSWLVLTFLCVWDLIAVLTPKGPLRQLVAIASQRNDNFPSMIYSSAMAWLVTSEEENAFGNPPSSTNANANWNNSTRMSTSISCDAAPPNSHPPIVSALIKKSVEKDESIEVMHRLPSCEAQECDDHWSKDRGIKIGIGDLVFYSVLVGKACAYNDWNCIFACVIAILVGLSLTLLLLVIFEKPLPALPISISLGIIFYFSTSQLISPFINSLNLYDYMI